MDVLFTVSPLIGAYSRDVFLRSYLSFTVNCKKSEQWLARELMSAHSGDVSFTVSGRFLYGQSINPGSSRGRFSYGQGTFSLRSSVEVKHVLSQEAIYRHEPGGSLDRGVN